MPPLPPNDDGGIAAVLELDVPEMLSFSANRQAEPGKTFSQPQYRGFLYSHIPFGAS
jgi:hypothetical protein